MNIQNPGSVLGEAIGAEMEKALNVFLTALVESYGYHFLSKSPSKNKKETPKKLLMYDKFGTAYNLDAVIANESMQYHLLEYVIFWRNIVLNLIGMKKIEKLLLSNGINILH